MASLKGREIVVIDDESEDEVEILEHGESRIFNLSTFRPSRPRSRR
jgi:hypothetical protein